jgi:membrane protease YdiL (CAAX protease family)
MIGGMEFLDAAGLGRNEWWRYALGLGLIVFATFFVGGVPLAVGVMVVTLDGRPATDVNRTNGALIGVSPGLSLALTLLPFVMAFCAILLTARLIHRRPASSLVAPGRPIRWGRVAQGFAAWFVAGVVNSLVEAVIFPGRYSLTLDPGRLLPFAVVATFLFPIQSSSEELFFRGYLLQGLGRLTRNRLLLAFVTGLIFAGLHIENPEVGSEFWLVMAFYFAFGVALALISMRDNGLELALGVHAANNLFTALFANFKGSAVESPSIFTAAGFTPWYSLVSTLIGLAVLYLVFFGRRLRSDTVTT